VNDGPPPASSEGSDVGTGNAAGASLGRTVARNTAFNLVGRFVNVLGWILIAPIMLRALGPERFGLWSLLTVLSGIYLTFDFGLSSAITKFVSEFRASNDRSSLRGIYSLAACLYGALSLAIVATIVLLRGPLLDFFRIAPALRHEANGALVVAAVVYGIMNFYTLFGAVLGGYQRLDLWNRVSIVVTVIQLGAIALALALGGDLVVVMSAMGAAMIAGVLLSCFAVRSVDPGLQLDRSEFRTALLKRLVGYGIALQIINAGALAMVQLDKVLFARFVSLAAAGQFELGLRLTFAAWTLPSFLLPPLLPAFSEIAASADRSKEVRLYLRASRYVFALAFPVAFGTIALAPAVLLAWLGPGHQQAAQAAIALAALLSVNIFTGVGSAVVRGSGRPWIEAEYLLIAAGLHVAMSLVLIPRYGYVGGLWSLLISGALASLHFVRRLHRLLGIPVFPFLVGVAGRPMLAAAIGSALAWWASGSGAATLEGLPRWEVLLRVALAGTLLIIAAFFTMILTRFLSFSELRELGSMIRGGRTPIASAREA
jgi:O-antigen/teichoic acid export membrane protein